MKIRQLSIPTVAAAALFALSFPADTTGFSTLGTMLSPAQRDVRVFNNFTAPGANNNLTPDANFPGYFGADMAIWKACIEWGSRLHGDGNGDSTQPFGLGSGGANFDPSFQGNATAVGNTNANTHSQISGCSGGTLAYAEGPANDGWRIRYYECWVWQDGPGPIGGGSYDLQSVACHEYGHSVGLGHSGSGSATMAPSISPGSEGPRSINADDIAGLQFIYGAATVGVKPIISGLSAVGTVLTITGQNFDTNFNTIWLTQAATGGTGEPIKVLATPSSAGGTQIVINVPVAAGPGDVLVKNQAGSGQSVSNAWPFFPNEPPPCPPVVNYCVGAPHSSGAGSTMSLDGSQSVLLNDFTLEANDAPANKSGIFYYGPNQIQVAFGDGFRCIGGSTKRLPVIQTDFVGYAAFTLNLATAANISVGATQNFQFWFRDPMGPGGTGFNTSDALEVEFCD